MSRVRRSVAQPDRVPLPRYALGVRPCRPRCPRYAQHREALIRAVLKYPAGHPSRMRAQAVLEAHAAALGSLLG